MAQRIFVSIDWDYCIPIHIINDWGVTENPFFLHLVWGMRKLMTVVNEVPSVTPFEDIEPESDIIPSFPSRNISVSESHSSAYFHFSKLIKEGDEITFYHFDLHHDIWDAGESIIAENWLYRLILDSKATWNVVHILPEWAEEYGYGNKGEAFTEEELVKDLKAKTSNLKSWQITQEPPEELTVDSLFICRSGCWIPPACDSAFKELAYSFCALSNLDEATIYGKPLDPR